MSKSNFSEELKRDAVSQTPFLSGQSHSLPSEGSQAVPANPDQLY